MTRFPSPHLNDEELALVADGIMSHGETGINAHLSSCEECQNAVAEALRGLSLLALASEPPPDLATHVAARRWAAAHNRSPQVHPEESEDIAEVAGRDMDTDRHESDDAPPEPERDDDD